MDEMSRQILKQVRAPIVAKSGEPRRYEHHYNGAPVHVLRTVGPPRVVLMRDCRTKVVGAECIREVLGEHYSKASAVVLVMDNLNTHRLLSLFEAYAPAEVRHLPERREIHYTPKHGYWLSITEIEQSVMARQCLSRRVPDRKPMERLTSMWAQKRNATGGAVDWQFTTDDARIKLKRLYPKSADFTPR